MVRAKRQEDWGIPDPKELPPDEYRRVRDLIGEKVRALLSELWRADDSCGRSGCHQLEKRPGIGGAAWPHDPGTECLPQPSAHGRSARRER
jgi:hypothetical protein